MNENLVSLFSLYYHEPANPNLVIPDHYDTRASKLLTLFRKWNIRKFFDAGCGDRKWMKNNLFVENNIMYFGGDISPYVASFCKETFPELSIQHHDMTTDPFPEVDLIFSSDVVIHLSDNDKIKFLKNFLNSSAKFLLITHSGNHHANHEIVYTDQFPFAPINWHADPWNFPVELDTIIDDVSVTGRRLSLWSKEQLLNVIK